MPDPWADILRATRDIVGADAFRSWLQPTRLDRLEANTIFLRVPNPYYEGWIRDNYQEVIREQARKVLGREIRLRYVLDNDTAVAAVPVAATPHTNVDADMTFSSFVVGDSNKFAHAAAQNVSDNPARNFNPLFVFSDVGLGKTHLLHAIGNQLLEQRPQTRVLYLRAEAFYQQMIDALRSESLKAFQERYRRNCDVLLVDDVQFFAGKTRSSDEFFHTFNALMQARKQIVLTADKKPHELEGMEERLRSRFAMGLVADIDYPDNETKMAILLERAAIEGVELPEDVAYFIASFVSGNVRELLGAFKRVSFIHKEDQRGHPLTVDFARAELQDYLGEQRRSLTIEGIAAAVATYFNLKLTDLKGPSRKKAFSQARHLAMYLARKHTGATYGRIGEFYHRDHSTIIEAVRNMNRRIDDDRRIQDQVDSIEKGLKGMGR
jgi:chromosomal replication initiator protein